MCHDLDHLIPHRPPVRMISRLLRADEDGIEASAMVDPCCYGLGDDGRLTASTLIELIAQAAAAGQTDASGQARPVEGMLVGVSAFGITRRPAPGDTLRIHACVQQRLDPFVLIAGTIKDDQGIVAEGRLQVYLTTTDPA